MDRPDSTVPSDELLAQLGWVRALASRLVADPDVADDVLQQVCLLALQKAPREAGAGPRLRAWLATATRRLADHAGRGEHRRRRREQAAARVDAVPSTADLAVHREALRGLVEAVTALDETAYAVIVARYFEGRSVAEIAAAGGASPDAVRQRLSRARQQLRGRLQTLLQEDRAGRLRAALPLVPVGAALPSAGAPALGQLGGVLVAKTFGSGIAKLALGLLVLACVLGGAWIVLHEGDKASRSVATGGSPARGAAAGGADATLPAADSGAAQQLVVSAPADAASSSEATGSTPAWPPGIVTYVVSGRVVDAHGAPWAGARVLSVLDESTGQKLGIKTWSHDVDLATLPSTTTDASGRFALTNPWLPAVGAFSRIFGLTAMPVVIVQVDGMAYHAFTLSDHDGRDRDLGDLVLSMKGATIRARLVDEHDAPIAGAAAGIWSGGAVQEARGTPGLPGGPRDFNLMGLSRVTSDAAGRFEIPGLWPSRFDLSVHDASHERRTLRDLQVAAGETLDLGDIVLGPGGEIAGTLRDAAGAPIARAEVWAWDAGTAFATDVGSLEPDDWGRADPLPAVLDALHEARAWGTDRSPVTTDADGRFRKTGLTGELRDVFIEAEGFEPLRVPGVLVGSTDLKLALAPETNLDVRVVDDRSGAALAAATLRAFRASTKFAYGEPPAIERRVTPGDGAGAHVVHTIGPQGTRLVAGAPGRATQHLEVAADAAQPVIVRLGAACAIAGRLQDAQGQPVAGATITVRPGADAPLVSDDRRPSPDDDRRTATAAADGSFRFDDLGEGPSTLHVRASGFVTSSATTIELGAGETLELPPLVLQRACGISGTLRRTDGTPAAGLMVSVHKNRLCKVDRAGGFGFADLEPGDLTLQVIEDLASSPMLAVPLTLAPSEARVLDLLLPQFPIVRGRVTAGGAPAAGTVVRVVEQPQHPDYRALEVAETCDAHGEYALELRQEGRHVLRAERPHGGASAAVTLDAAFGLERTLDFALGLASLAGVVVDAGDGQAAAGVELRLERDGEPVTAWLPTSGTGAFDVPSLLAGDYVLRTRGKAYPEVGLDVHLEDGQRLADLRVQVARGAVIDGLVVDSHGQPEGAWVYLVWPGEPLAITQHGAPKGVFRIEGLAPGHYRVVVASGSYADWLQDPQFADLARGSEQASLEVELAAGEQRRVTLQVSE